MKKIWCIIESYPKYWPERLALFFYITCVMIISRFHEPWFDEAVSWDIARDTPIKDILFYVPHYEGHPQLWHLILAPFAKLGAPYEITLTLVNLLFTGTAILLILRFAPFPRLVKLLLPFTYFFFYQYGVIARPYSMTMLAFVLLSVFYGKRNIHPGRFVLSLMFLCATSAYGIVFAGGIAIVWLLEIWNKTSVPAFIARFLKDKRFFWMLLLLLYALLLIYFISPNKNTYAWNLASDNTPHNNPVIRLLYMFIIIWSDILCTSVLTESTLIYFAHFSFFSFFRGLIIGSFILSAIIYLAYKKKTLTLFAFPAALFSIFSSIIYIYNHHIGVALLFLLFWLWCSLEKESRKDDKVKVFSAKHIRDKYQKALSCSAIIFCSYIMLISLYWTAISCINEISFVYSAGRNEATFIRENHLEQFNIWCDWSKHLDKSGEQTNSTHDSYYAYTMLPYFNENIFSTSAYGTDGTYILHVLPGEDEFEKNVEQWKEKGYPDVLIADISINSIYDPAELSGRDYVFVYYEWTGRIWKTNKEYRLSLIRVRKDLAEELGLQEVVPQ